MMAPKRLINRAAVRGAFHGRGTRVPPGFFGEVERSVYVLLRRVAAGEKLDLEVKAAIVDLGRLPLKPETTGRIGAALHKFFNGDESYLKQGPLKEALRGALGADRIETSMVAYVNAVVSLKVGDAAVKASARGMGGPQGVPSGVLRAFLRSPERKAMTVGDFCRRWQDSGFRREWTGRTERTS